MQEHVVGVGRKLFVATAAARAVHEGRLSYDVLVREAMRDVTIPTTYPGEITLRHLLTHIVNPTIRM